MSTIPPPPPPEPIPTSTPIPQQAPPPAYPPPTAQFPTAFPAAAPPPTSSKAGLIIGLGITVALVVLAGALFALFSALAKMDDGAGPSSTSPSTAPSPGAPSDTSCDGCITSEDLLTLRLPDGIPALGIEQDPEYQFAKPSTIGLYVDASVATFESGGGTPTECYFAIGYAPESPTNPDATQRSDRVIDLGDFFSATSYASQVGRVFPTELAAAAFPDSLRDAIAGCPHYSFSYEGGGFWSTDVTSFEVGTSSPAVTAVGWTEEYTGIELYVVDLQYRNLVVRTIYNHDVSDGDTEQAFRDFIIETSAAMEALG